LGSADLMHRNLDRRVETLVQVKDASVRTQLQNFLNLAMSAEVAAWELDHDGCWMQRTGEGTALADYQRLLMTRTTERATDG
jgi:polyphosphate kinase